MVRLGVIYDASEGPLGPVRRALGIDPGSPFAHFCVLDAPAEPGTPPRIVACRSIRWRGTPEEGAIGACEIAGLLEGVERIGAETQFLVVRSAREDGGADGGAAGGYFGSLIKIAHSVGVTAGISAALGGLGVVQVSPGTWRALLSGWPRKTRDEARRASLEALRLAAPGQGPGRGGAWRAGDHDLAAAYWIAAWALGIRSVRDLGISGPIAPPAPKRKRHASPKPAKTSSAGSAGAEGAGSG